MGALRGIWKEGFFTGYSERYVKVGSGNGAPVCTHRGPLRGTWSGAPLLGTPERHFKEGFGNGASLSLYTFHERNLEEGLLYWGLRETHIIQYKALEMEHFFL
jgi:hypothetical protein